MQYLTKRCNENKNYDFCIVAMIFNVLQETYANKIRTWTWLSPGMLRHVVW
jgi:hypothetical protein